MGTWFTDVVTMPGVQGVAMTRNDDWVAFLRDKVESYSTRLEARRDYRILLEARDNESFPQR